MAELNYSYHAGLVTLSVLIAIASSFVALAAVPRMHDKTANHGRASLWSVVFGISLGAGIWSMHFIAMLALNLPVPVRYDPALTLTSLVVGMCFATLSALPLRHGGRLGGRRLAGMGLLAGLGISGMHYTGMAAMRMAADMFFEPAIVILSVLIAISASSAALWIANRLRESRVFGKTGIKAAAAVVMGLAVSAIHYTGMAAVHFQARPAMAGPYAGLDTPLMVAAISVIAALVQGGVLVSAALDESWAATRRELALETRMSSLLDAVPDAIFSINAQGDILHANPAACEMFGYEPEQWAEMNVHALVPDDIRAAHPQWMADEIANGRHKVIGATRRVRGRRRDGSVFPCELVISQYHAEGEAHLSAVVRDVSKRQAAEARARYQGRLNAALNHLLAIAIRDEPLAERLRQGLAGILDQDWLGVAPKGAVFVREGEGLAMRAAVNMGDAGAMCAQVARGECLCGRALQTGEVVLSQHVDQTHTQRTDDMEDHGHAIFPLRRKADVLGILNLYLPAGRELREQERAFLDSVASILAQMLERDMALSQMRRLETAIGQAPEGIFITDHEGRIVYANAAAAGMVGITRESLIGMYAAEARGGKRGDAIYNGIFSSLNEGQSWYGDIEFAHEDGTRHTIERSIAPVMEDGVVRYHVCVDTDVTEQRVLQAKLEHTQRLESLGVLAGGIAHDFNNILTAIMGNAALARMKMKDTDPTRAHLERIEESSQRAADLCRQMLAYSGKGKFVTKALNLSQMVEEITKLLDVSIAKNVVLKFHLAENLPAVEADSAQLQQVIMNLVINASDAIGEKSGVISLATGVMRADAAYLAGAFAADDIEPGTFVFLEVSDTGCGMDVETQKQLFDPFFTTKFTGRGLGMSAVLGIVRGHHGAIKVYSEPGRGTTFKVLLPTAKQAATDEGERKDGGEWRGTGTVLVVDDEETIRETAAMMLTGMGFDTLAAEDGAQAVEMYRRHRHDIVAVLLDMTMPRLDGKGCFRELRRINRNVRVVLSSGYNEQDATTRFAGQGLAAFIQKPYTPEALQAKMREALEC